MPERPNPGARRRTVSSRPPPRHESQSRVRVPDERLPSTIPPRPLPSQAELAPLEWWLDAHMNVASNLMCLEQGVEVASDERPGADLVSGYLAPLGELRDALYELYCDCADPRMQAAQEAGGPLAGFVSGLYALCDDVLETLGLAMARSAPADVALSRAELRARCAAFRDASTHDRERTHAAVAEIVVDKANPVDPLRDLATHLGDIDRAADAIGELSKE